MVHAASSVVHAAAAAAAVVVHAAAAAAYEGRVGLAAESANRVGLAAAAYVDCDAARVGERGPSALAAHCGHWLWHTGRCDYWSVSRCAAFGVQALSVGAH